MLLSMVSAFQSSSYVRRRLSFLYSSPESINPHLPQRSNQQAKREMIDYLYEPPPPLPTFSTNPTVVLEDGVGDLVHTIVRAADGRKAENIVALYVAHVTTVTSVLVVVSGNSRPQNQAICAAIRTAVPNAGGTEGTAESGWMILDYGSVMVHVMTPKSRLFYNVEGHWKQPRPVLDQPTTTATAIPMDISHILIPNTASAPPPNAPIQREEVDPFWS